MNKIVKFHIDNNYYVKIQPIPNLIGCTATFPPNLLTNQPGYIKTYTVNEKLSYIEILSTLNKTLRHINVNKIVIRLLITEDILLNTINRGISRHLMIIAVRFWHSASKTIPHFQFDRISSDNLIIAG